MSSCESCRRFLEDMRQVSEQVRQVVPRPDAPVEVRDRLFKAIAHARTAPSLPHGTNRKRWWLAAALAAVSLAGGAWLGWNLLQQRASSERDALGAIAEDHLRSQQSAGVVSSDSLQVAQWLADRLPFAVDVPIFPEAQLKGARLLFLDRQAGAVVEYVLAGRPLAYYVLPTTDVPGSARPREVRLVSRAGYRVAAWEDAGLTHALVAGLPGPKLVELAHYCMRQMMAIAALSQWPVAPTRPGSLVYASTTERARARRSPPRWITSWRQLVAECTARSPAPWQGARLRSIESDSRPPLTAAS